ncbi:hypothetical protein EKO27_g10401 [Xylaria grammica]|uniref:Uncharacterized protein n=1 Tax=Xylaria grammica TaxID=363999 RepID=A0A439CRA7_9PEZI|nr:hypothetical protein EKO27_g10401 [Xylaria grammica]
MHLAFKVMPSTYGQYLHSAYHGYKYPPTRYVPRVERGVALFAREDLISIKKRVPVHETGRDACECVIILRSACQFRYNVELAITYLSYFDMQAIHKPPLDISGLIVPELKTISGLGKRQLIWEIRSINLDVNEPVTPCWGSCPIFNLKDIAIQSVDPRNNILRSALILAKKIRCGKFFHRPSFCPSQPFQHIQSLSYTISPCESIKVAVDQETTPSSEDLPPVVNPMIEQTHNKESNEVKSKLKNDPPTELWIALCGDSKLEPEPAIDATTRIKESEIST